MYWSFLNVKTGGGGARWFSHRVNSRLSESLVCADFIRWLKLRLFNNISFLWWWGCALHRSKLSRVFVCFHFCNVVLYIEKGYSLSVRTGFLVELVSSWTRAKCKHYTSIAVFKTNCVLQKSRWNIFKPQ